MGVALWLVFGVSAGVLAALLNPVGRKPGGSGALLALGVLGALLGGFSGRAMGLYAHSGDIAALALAALGAAAVPAIYLLVFGTPTVR